MLNVLVLYSIIFLTYVFSKVMRLILLKLAVPDWKADIKVLFCRGAEVVSLTKFCFEKIFYQLVMHV